MSRIVQLANDRQGDIGNQVHWRDQVEKSQDGNDLEPRADAAVAQQSQDQPHAHDQIAENTALRWNDQIAFVSHIGFLFQSLVALYTPVYWRIPATASSGLALAIPSRGPLRSDGRCRMAALLWGPGIESVPLEYPDAIRCRRP